MNNSSFGTRFAGRSSLCSHLLLVEGAGLEERGEVQEDGLGLPGLRRDLLEAGDDLGRAEGAAGASGELRGLDDLVGGEELLELHLVQVLGAGQAEPTGELEREAGSRVVGGVRFRRIQRTAADLFRSSLTPLSSYLVSLSVCTT